MRLHRGRRVHRGTDGNISFTARTIDSGVSKTYKVPFVQVRQFSRRADVRLTGEPDDRLELSVIEVQREPAGWRVWLNPLVPRGD